MKLYEELFRLGFSGPSGDLALTLSDYVHQIFDNETMEVVESTFGPKGCAFIIEQTQHADLDTINFFLTA